MKKFPQKPSASFTRTHDKAKIHVYKRIQKELQTIIPFAQGTEQRLFDKIGSSLLNKEYPHSFFVWICNQEILHVPEDLLWPILVSLEIVEEIKNQSIQVYKQENTFTHHLVGNSLLSLTFKYILSKRCVYSEKSFLQILSYLSACLDPRELSAGIYLTAHIQENRTSLQQLLETIHLTILSPFVFIANSLLSLASISHEESKEDFEIFCKEIGMLSFLSGNTHFFSEDLKDFLYQRLREKMSKKRILEQQTALKNNLTKYIQSLPNAGSMLQVFLYHCIN